jgi:hypothetical protein
MLGLGDAVGEIGGAEEVNQSPKGGHQIVGVDFGISPLSVNSAGFLPGGMTRGSVQVGDAVADERPGGARAGAS